MTSKERHEARYQRRKEKRDEKKRQRNEGYTFDAVTDFRNLRKSFYEARKGVNWKASVQRYGCNVLRNTMQASTDLRAGKNISKGESIPVGVCAKNIINVYLGTAFFL